jgi:hypothetical protein
MPGDTATFHRLIGPHLAKGVEQPVPDYSPDCVVNRFNYAYFTHHGKVDAMNYSTAIFLINDDVRALYVIYAPDTNEAKQRRYMVKTLDPDIGEGDFVVIPSTVGLKLAVGEVTDVDVEVDFDSTTAVPWVVSHIDFKAFGDILEQEEVAIAAIRQANFQEKKRKLADTLLASRKVAQLSLAKKKRQGLED